MNKPLYIIGIDGGGTKTTSVLCALDGTILAEAQGGPSNFQITSAEKSVNTILDLIETCCHSVGCSISEIGAIVAGLAGAGRVADQQRMMEEIFKQAEQRNLGINKLVVESDARIALEGAFGGKQGIIIIGGTGSIVFGKNERGKIFRAGGWGRLFGDEGSGYAIGREAIRAVAKILDGYGEKTKLQNILKDRFALGNQEAIINAVYKGNFAVASIAPALIEAAKKGDKVANKIIKQSTVDLMNVVLAVVNKMSKGRKGKSKLSISLVGSLFENENVYSKLVRASIKRQIRDASIIKPESSPVIGATLMAIKEINHLI